MITHYNPQIRAATGTDENEAAVIEEVLRVDIPTLDHLSSAELAREARTAQKILAELRASDPDCAAWYERSALGSRA